MVCGGLNSVVKDSGGVPPHHPHRPPLPPSRMLFECTPPTVSLRTMILFHSSFAGLLPWIGLPPISISALHPSLFGHALAEGSAKSTHKFAQPRIRRKVQLRPLKAGACAVQVEVGCGKAGRGGLSACLSGRVGGVAGNVSGESMRARGRPPEGRDACAGRQCRCSPLQALPGAAWSAKKKRRIFYWPCEMCSSPEQRQVRKATELFVLFSPSPDDRPVRGTARGHAAAGVCERLARGLGRWRAELHIQPHQLHHPRAPPSPPPAPPAAPAPRAAP